MRGSIAEKVEQHVGALAPRSFVEVRDVEGPRGPIESAFSRLAAKNELQRVRKGLYWKGATSSMGTTPPRIEEVALKLGGPGSGPAGVAAAHWLGITSQVPATFTTAVPTRVPSPIQHVRFTQRPIGRLLRGLTPVEVAVIEVLRSGPSIVEETWSRFGEVVSLLIERGDVRKGVLSTQIADEPHRKARLRWSDMQASHPSLLEAA